MEQMTKDGYELSPKIPRNYGITGGSTEDPVIFQMWKKGISESLIQGSKFYGIIPDGRTYTIDFLQQKKIEGDNASGDIKVSIVRPKVVVPREKFDWSFDIEGVQGGLVETQDEFMYLAPEAGYQPKYVVNMLANDPNWKREIDKLQFYFQSRDGKVYGRFVVDIIPDYNEQSVFNVRYAVNPNGSRNL